ncbi:MAG: hypothetical protein AB7I27_02640 [Bacteriovoracaceae bacterium]
MKKLALFSLLLSLSIPGVYADHHEGAKEKCSCTKECKENCEKGKSEKCECKACDCKNSDHCDKH